jgi:hypothetical protein
MSSLESWSARLWVSFGGVGVNCVAVEVFGDPYAPTLTWWTDKRVRRAGALGARGGVVLGL